MNYRFSDSVRRHIATLDNPQRFIDNLEDPRHYMAALILDQDGYPVGAGSPSGTLTYNAETDTCTLRFYFEADTVMHDGKTHRRYGTPGEPAVWNGYRWDIEGGSQDWDETFDQSYADYCKNPTAPTGSADVAG